jgi:phage shock protein A
MSTEDLRDHLRELRAEANAARAERERKQRESDEARARAAENQRRAEQAAAQATGPSAEYLARKAAGWKKPPNPEAVPTPEELARIAAFLDAPAAEIDR